MRIYKFIFFLKLLLFSGNANCTSLRSCFEVYFYDLHVGIDIDKKSIAGYNTIHYLATEDFQQLQVDLFANLDIDSIVFKNQQLDFNRDSHAVIIKFPSIQMEGDRSFIRIHYKGNPVVAKNAPWDGGFVWATDSLGNPWVGVACEGIGASSWWPCKDNPADEPDSMRMTFNVPADLTCVGNGNLIKKEIFLDRAAYTWMVNYPINTYNVTLNIANYQHFKDEYIRPDSSTLTLDYYVLPYHLTKAKKHFEQVSKVLKAHEYFFGEYPFPKDGYALVETPYLGMEHQSAIAYGNNFENELGDFDFIIVHETAHEWWGNSLTAADMGELWIHESFATYSESLLLEYFYGSNSALNYLKGQKEYIKNKNPMLKPLDVNFFHPEDSDIYYKGAWMLHTLRNVLANDSVWFKILKGIAIDLQYSIVNTNQIIQYFNSHSSKDLSPIFEQYLKFSSIPTFVYSIKLKKKKASITYKWEADVKNFNMPVIIELHTKKRIKLAPSSAFQTLSLNRKEAEDMRIMTDLFYIKTEKINP